MWLLIATKGNVFCVVGVSAIKYVLQLGVLCARVRACANVRTHLQTPAVSL